MQKRYLLGLLAIIPMILLVQNVDASVPWFVPQEGRYFQVFEDGASYIEWDMYNGKQTLMYHDGESYNCKSNNGYLNPVCVEIILRSLP